MAKIVQDNIVISVSKIARDADADAPFVPEAMRQQIEEIVAELLGEGVVVEVLS